MDMCDVNKTLPQAGTLNRENPAVSSDRVKAPVADAGRMDFGGDHTHMEIAAEVGDIQSPGRGVEGNPFSGKRIARTPPCVERANSLPGASFHRRVVGPNIINKSQNGPHAQQAAIEASAEMKRTQALERLEKLTSELHEFVQSKVNIHKEIKTKTTSVVNALRRFKTLDEEWQSSQRRTPRVTPEKTDVSIRPYRQSVSGTVEEMDTGAEGDDSESNAGDTGDTWSRKRKERHSPDSANKQAKKKKDSGKSPPQSEVPKKDGQQEASPWQVVQTRKAKKQNKEQAPKQHTKRPLKEDPPVSRPRKPRKFTRPDALIIRPVEKEKYAEILLRIKKEVQGDEVCSTVEKINRTRTGDMLITLSRKSTDKGQALQRAIEEVLKEDAKVISKGPQDDLEIRDIDDTTTKGDIQAALQKAAGENCEIPLAAIKIRKAYRGTQTALVTLAVQTAQKVLGEHGKIRIGWVNCRVRSVKRPTQCYKCCTLGMSRLNAKAK